MRRALLTCLGACSFQTSYEVHDAAIDGDGDAPDAMIDGAPGSEPPMPTPLCNSADATLRACFTFDDTLNDGSGSNIDLTASGTPAYVAGHAGGSKALNTATGTFTTPATTALDITTFTFKMWIRPNAIPGAGLRMGVMDSGGRYRVFLQPQGAIRCAVTNGADLTSSTGAVSANVWQRVTCRYNGSAIQIYVNGTMVGSSNVTSTVPATAGNMVVGHNNPSGENFNGAIDDLQIFSTLVAP